MSETSSPEVPAGTAVLVSETPVTPGQLLRAARLKAGVHLAVLSVNLKVPVRELEALEADQLDPGKGPVFARALASSVCRQLRMEPAAVLALMPQGMQALMPVRTVSVMDSSGPWSRLLNALTRFRPSKPAAWLVALMLLVTGALIWLPSPLQWTWLPAWVGLQQAEPLASAASDPAFMSSNGTVVEPVTSTSDQAVSQAAQVMVSASPLTAASAASPTVGKLDPQVPQPTTATTSALSFAATEPSWIEVRDVNKQVLWSGVLPAGETKQLTSAQPMSVVIGRVQGISVTWRGQAFDLKPHTQATVARFELKP